MQLTAQIEKLQAERIAYLVDLRRSHGISLTQRLLNRKFGIIPDKLSTRVQQLSLEQLDAVVEALLDFSTINDLQTWLENQSQD